jgi:DNA/RNA-binding domain of Phe-tRNA-synthetase-like protein
MAKGGRVNIVLASEVVGRLKLGAVTLEGVAVGPSPTELHQQIDAYGATMRARYAGREPSQIPELQLARRLYRALGMDPTRTRPSSEALLRRLLRGEPLARINSVVDAGNLFSVEALLPIGLYDADRIQGPVSADVAAQGEGYEGIRKEWVHLGGRIALRDGVGWFGNPSSDSARTSIRNTTTTLTLAIFVPADLPEGELDRALAQAEELQLRWNGGRRRARCLLA